MPTYEYRCEHGHTFEVMQRMTDDPLSSCQTCEAPVQRVFHPVAVHFKGSGFYNTDYGTRKRSRETDGEPGSDSKPESKTDAKSESKTEAKPESKSDTKPEAKSAASSSD